MAETIITNPIAWLHVRLNGGWRRILHITGGAALLILVVHVLIYRGVQDNVMTVASFSAGAFRVMLVIQALIFLIGGTNAIKVAIHRDFTTEMISSHRQTGMRGESVVLGYLIGPTSLILALTLLCWLTCTILALLTGGIVSAATPTLLLVCLAASGGMYWTLAILGALATRGSFNAAGIVFVVGIISFTGVLELVPGLNLLAGMQAGGAALGSGGGQLSAIAITLLAQLVFAGLIFLAAARKYARDDVPAFSPLLAFTLLAFCTLLGATGLEWFGNTSPGRFGQPSFEQSTQILVTLALLLMIAFLAIAASARLSAAYGHRKSRDPSLTMRRPRSLVETSLAATLLVFGILGAIQLIGQGPLSLAQAEMHGPMTLGLMALSFLFNLLCVGGLLRFVFAYTQKINWVLLGYIVVFWLMPPLADLAICVTMDSSWGNATSHTWLLACSPCGVWAALLLPSVQAPLMIGLIFQGIVAVAALILAKRARY